MWSHCIIWKLLCGEWHRSGQVRLFCDRRSVGQSVLVSAPPTWPDFYYCLAFADFMLLSPSLTRGRVCNLLVQFAVTLGSKSRRTHDHILLSHLRLPQPGGPDPCIYIPQEQGCPIISPGTKPSFCGLLRLVGLRWRYSNPPPHGSDWDQVKVKVKVKVKVTLRLTVSQYVLVSSPIWDFWSEFFF
jgi:hypothetical protein